MGLFTEPKIRILDANGDPVAGAKVNFYENGTVTPRNTYSDRGLTSANANPVVADSNGLLGMIWGEAERYKVVITDASDVTIYEADDIEVPLGSASSLASRIDKIAESPLTYGAVGDGASDESTEVQQAIDAAETAGTYTVDLFGLTFRCDSALTLHSGVRIINGDLDFSNSTDANNIIILGTQGTPVSLDAQASQGSRSISADGTGLARNQAILITDNTDWGGGDSGEVNRVRTANGTTVNLARPVFDDYNNALSATFVPLTVVKDVMLENLTITGPSSGAYTMVQVENADRVVIRNCEFSGYAEYGVEILTSIDCRVEGCNFYNSTQSGSMAVNIGDGSAHTRVRDCTFYEGVTAIGVGSTPGTQEGVCHDTIISGCKVSEQSSNALEIAANHHQLMVQDCEFWGSTGNVHLINTDGFCNLTVRDCVFNYASDDAIHIGYTAAAQPTHSRWNLSILNNVIETPADNGISVEVSASLSTVQIVGNMVHKSGDSAIYLDVDETTFQFVVCFNRCYDCSTNDSAAVLWFDQATGTKDGQKYAVHGNHLDANGTTANVMELDVLMVDNVDITLLGNTLEGGAYGISNGATNFTGLFHYQGNLFGTHNSGATNLGTGTDTAGNAP